MKLKKITDFIYSSAIFVASVATKNSENVWLFGAQGGHSYSDNAKYFFEWILDKHQQEKCFWVTKDKEIYQMLVSQNIPVLYFYDIRNILLIAKAKYIVCTHSHTGNDVYKFINKSKMLITLWHGIPLKKMRRTPRRNYLDHLYVKTEPNLFLVTSNKDAELFSDLYGIDSNNFFIGTYPRVNDLILRAKSTQTILYAPTFRDGMNQEYYDQYIFPNISELEQLNENLIRFNYVLFIKMHPYVDAKFPNLDGFSNIQLISALEDVQSYLAQAKILITDYSSIYFDYLNLDREIIFFIPDYEWYHKESNRGLLCDYEEVAPGHKVVSWSEVQDTLIEIFEDNITNDFSKSRDATLNFFYSKRDLDNSDLFNTCKRIK